MLNNRAILTVYNILLWPCFALIAAIGYVSYRKNKWNLEGKLSYQWHYTLSANDRARIQANVSLPKIGQRKKIHAIAFNLIDPHSSSLASLLWIQIIHRFPRALQQMLPANPLARLQVQISNIQSSMSDQLLHRSVRPDTLPPFRSHQRPVVL